MIVHNGSGADVHLASSDSDPVEGYRINKDGKPFPISKVTRDIKPVIFTAMDKHGYVLPLNGGSSLMLYPSADADKPVEVQVGKRPGKRHKH